MDEIQSPLIACVPDSDLPTEARHVPTKAALADAIRKLARSSVLVVGDAMLDRYIYGTVERVSREAPVPVLAVDREVALPGGAGNVVRNLGALGVAVAFV
jgi:D-beta-D-heptose 7-phosphate kinase/D-beta-D-heptose 1-phosphate adenosyltransferase